MTARSDSIHMVIAYLLGLASLAIPLMLAAWVDRPKPHRWTHHDD